MPDRSAPLLFPELAAPVAAPPPPPDAAARAEALDIRRSFVVEAPAGSGKTGLLIQRYLKLLTDQAVSTPEQVLAITFTNKAAGEMRDRVLSRLEDAREGRPARGDFERVTRELAEAVLARDRALGWRLLDQPHRINLRTIDSVSAEIARSLPVLSGAGGSLAPAEDATPLFQEAARRTVLLLGGDEGATDPEFEPALRHLLLHRDANLPDCERLIAEMLAVRDQWGALVPLGREALTDEALDGEVLPRLQLALEQAICAELTVLAETIPADVLKEVARLAEEMSYAPPYNRDVSPMLPCRGRRRAPGSRAEDIEHWRALVHLLVKPSAPRDWRKSFARNHLHFEMEKGHQTRLKELLTRVDGRPEIVDALCRIEQLPPAVYPEAQWRVAKSLFRVLRRALVELQLVFAERGQCDFTELSLLAGAALSSTSGRDDLGSALGARLEHLLVDEMQDTSSGQYELIERLTESWDGHSQTVFLVGDPRQSIYLFRHAKVERFLDTLRTGRLGELPLSHLRLTANFRSQRRLVEQLNHDLAQVFAPEPGAAATGTALPFQAADPVLPAAPAAEGLRWHATPVRVRGRAGAAEEASAEERTDPGLRQLQARRNARTIRRIAADWLARPLPEGRTEPWRLGVLVRTRRHLVEVVAALQSQRETDGPPVPFRAVEIEPLAERQEILDLTALTRILLHPADRAAGFALLRAPWCGLSLGDLHRLAGEDDSTLARRSVQRLIEDRGHLLDEDACRRMQRLWRVLDASARQRGQWTLAERVEFAWRSLGGDAGLTPDQLVHARRYLELLDEIAAQAALSGTPVEIGLLEERLRRLFAEPRTLPAGTGHVELLTIHRAKGLEWDVVMIPALERGQGITRGRMLTWAELDRTGGASGASPVMLAPIAARGEQADALTKWLRGIQSAREAAERKRLFYVAATRARHELHLFASPDINAEGKVRRAWDSLLESAYAAAEPHFLRSPEPRREPVPRPQPGVLDVAAGAVVHMPRRAAEGMPATEDGAAGAIEPQALDEDLYPRPVRPEIERLPGSFDPAARFAAARIRRIATPERSGAPSEDAAGPPGKNAFARPEGSFAARAFGTTVHALMELAASRIKAGIMPAQLLAEVAAWGPRIEGLLRTEGVGPGELPRFARETRRAVERALADPDGTWVLADRAEGATELALTAAAETGADRLTSIRVDRLFRAGAEPHAPGAEYLWIVDYKTATHSGARREAFLVEQRGLYAAQLERYAQVLGALHGLAPEKIRVALYYPLLPHLAWWTPGQQKEEDDPSRLSYPLQGQTAIRPW